MSAEDHELDEVLSRVREEPPEGLLGRILAASEDPELDAVLARVREEPPEGLLAKVLASEDPADPELDAVLARVREEPPAGLAERILASDEDAALDAVLARVREEPPADLLGRLLPEAADAGRPPIDFVAEMARYARGLLKPAIVVLAASLLVSVGLSLRAETSSQEGASAPTQIAYGSVSSQDLDAGAWLLGVSESK